MYLKRDEGEEHLHLSHLYQYVSAYTNSKEMVEELGSRIKVALLNAKEKIETQIVDLDGECCFHVHPSGGIVLMLPWKKYKVASG